MSKQIIKFCPKINGACKKAKCAWWISEIVPLTNKDDGDCAMWELGQFAKRDRQQKEDAF